MFKKPTTNTAIINLSSISIESYGKITAIFGQTKSSRTTGQTVIITHCPNVNYNDPTQTVPKEFAHIPQRITTIRQGEALKSCFITVVSPEAKEQTIFSIPRPARSVLHQLNEAGAIPHPDLLTKENFGRPDEAKNRAKRIAKIKRTPVF